jgi:branched-chain amino acid transport system permease protein
MRLARSQWILLAAVAASLLVSCFSKSINRYFLTILIGIGVNIILAVSLNLINGYTGQFSLGHAGFMAVGAYGSAAVTIYLGPKVVGLFGGSNALSIAVLFFIALFAGGVVAAIAGILVGAPSLRLKGDYLAIVTLGFGEIIRVIFRNIPSLGGALGLTGIPSYTTIFWTFGVAAVTVYVVQSIVNSTYGRGFLAVHDDEVAAEAMGINTTRYKIIAFVVGAFFAGVAGGLYAHDKAFIDPTGFNFMRSIEIVVMVILGGMGNNFGVICAAILLTLLPAILREYFRSIADSQMLIYSILLILLMLTRPQGLFKFNWRRKTASAAAPHAG